MSEFITNALWGWLLGWPWYAHVLLAAGIVLSLWGLAVSLYTFASKLGGWQAGVGVLLAAAGALAALWPKRSKHVTTEEQYDLPPVKKLPKKKRPTIFDSFR